MTHPDETRLNDYVDDLLTAADAAAVRHHLATCEPCRRTVEATRRLGADLAGLPRELSPQRDLRPTTLPRRGRRFRRGLRTGVPLRAAATILVVLTAGALTWLATGGRDGPSAPAAEPGAPVVPGVAIQPYAEAGRALLLTFEERRSDGPPEVARLVDRNLAAVDVAIAELERARAAAPEDPDLARLMEDRYRTRLQLLRGALALLSEG